MAGLVIRRQHPVAQAIFMTLEDEYGHVPLIVWPKVFQRYRLVLREPVLKVRGTVSPPGGHHERGRHSRGEHQGRPRPPEVEKLGITRGALEAERQERG